MKKLVIASNNAGKLREIRAILAPFGLDAVSQKEAGFDAEVEETRDDCITDRPERNRPRESLSPIERWEELPQIETNQQVADEPAHVLEHAEGVPGALAPEEGQVFEVAEAEGVRPERA